MNIIISKISTRHFFILQTVVKQKKLNDYLKSNEGKMFRMSGDKSHPLRSNAID